MPSLPKDLRTQLSRTTLAAREAAEAACRAALENLAVHEKDYRGHMTVEQRLLRNQLRARGRALGDTRDERSGSQEIKHLAEDAAYEHWHRLLFTRFLAENGLLHTDEENSNVPVTLEDCEELAPDLGAKDGFDLACRFASRTLPGVFRSDDPIFELTLPLEWQVKLREILDSLPTGVFTADDSLGWTYQFWQTQRKDEVNKAGNKIGADELPSVTQLFTEDYMVDFLLDNTLGAWHAGKALAANPKLAENAQSEEELRHAVALPGCPWKYLRFIEGKDGKWTPAADTFDGWPKTAKKLTCLDPCMGSGHFVVAMFERLVALRLVEEKLGEAAAVAAVIRDNLFGLEIDPRCTQIGAFNLALAAWRRVGHRALPAMNLACSGLAPNAKREEWLKLTEDAPNLRFQMGALYELFGKAPILGSLINPSADKAVTYGDAFHELQLLAEKALAQETQDDTAHEMAVAARGLAKAAKILAGQFTLVATNVPFLGQGKQNDVLKDFCASSHPTSKADLATVFVERCNDLCANGGSAALVTPQNWLFLYTYRKLRESLLATIAVNMVAELGSGAFQTPLYDFSFILLSLSKSAHSNPHDYVALTAATTRDISEKAESLHTSFIEKLSIEECVRSSDKRILTRKLEGGNELSKYAQVFCGLQTGDNYRYALFFWEMRKPEKEWKFLQRTPSATTFYDGLEQILLWEDGHGSLTEQPGFRDRLSQNRQDMADKVGVGFVVHRMGQLPTSLLMGRHVDQNGAVLIPIKRDFAVPIRAFLESPEYCEKVRVLDNKVGVTPFTLTKVPFDLAHWQNVAAVKYPHGLPKPFSSDPTQWLFNGHPSGATPAGAGLHVAVARLLGYQWPRQTGSSFPDCPALGPVGLEKLADDDGIVCLPPLNREQPAAARLRALLAEALGSFDEKSLLASAGKKGSKSKALEDWLRDEFFEQHCQLFHNRPFIWHVWDGRKDGFAALVNYHQLDHATLQKLTYTCLGNWIHDQEADAKADKPGAAERLVASRALQEELAKILEGEAPYDIFIRWKPLKDQPIGWHPNLNDGVRLNIRPFLLARDMGKKDAGILRANPKGIKWTKDRGKEPQRPKADYPWFWCEEEPGTDPTGGKEFTGNRWNDVHLTLERKRGAKG